MTTSLYDAAGGFDGLLRLAHAWHQRCLADPLASHPFPPRLRDLILRVLRVSA